jgi:hypothetical protein
MILARRCIIVSSFVFLFLGWTAQDAQAQALCADVCKPHTSACNEPCYGCLLDYPDGSCPQQEMYYTSCGDWAGACIPDDCTPNWVTQSTTQIGAWSSCFLWPKCNYYHSFNINECDSNECNINSNFYCRTRCENVKKGFWGGTTNACGCCTVFSNLGGCWGWSCPSS